MGSGLRVENFKINRRLTTSGNALQAKRNGTCSAVLSIGAVVFRLGHGVDAGRTVGGLDAGVSGRCGAVGMVPIGGRVGVFVAPGSADNALEIRYNASAGRFPMLKKIPVARLKPGMFMTIEPMINLGKPPVKLLSDGWTAVTRDKSLSAQFEHSIGITETGCEIFTTRPKGLHKPPYA